MNIYRSLRYFEQMIRNKYNDSFAAQELKSNLYSTYELNRSKEFKTSMKWGTSLAAILFADGYFLEPHLGNNPSLENIIISSIAGGSIVAIYGLIKQRITNKRIISKINHLIRAFERYNGSLKQFISFYEEVIKDNFEYYDNENVYELKAKLRKDYYKQFKNKPKQK